MLVAAHVVLSSLSIILAVINLFRPTKNGLRAVYGLTGGAFASGVILVVTTGADPVKSCISGSLFLGFVVISSLYTSRKLSHTS